MIFEIDLTTGTITNVGGDAQQEPPPSAVCLDRRNFTESGLAEDEAWLIEQLRQAYAAGAAGLRVTVYFHNNSPKLAVN